jgi:anti-sigma factor RsiW
MTELAINKTACRSQEVAAYLDGELSRVALLAFEEHLKECRSCSEKLEEQRLVLRTLDMAFGEEKSLKLPVDFARVVTAHAQTDMSGVREKRERGRALQLSVALALFSFALLGSAALTDSVFEPVRAFGRMGAAFVAILWRAIYDAGASLVVVVRIIGGFALASRALGLLSYLVLAGALVILLRLIRSYHRARVLD